MASQHSAGSSDGRSGLNAAGGQGDNRGMNRGSGGISRGGAGTGGGRRDGGTPQGR